MAFDGLRNAFSTEPLPFGDREWKGEVKDVPELADAGGDRNILTVDLVFKLTRTTFVDVSGAIDKYCSEGSTVDRPIEAMRVVNIVLEYIAQVRTSYL